MFRLETSPIPTFRGFTVKCFRQGRTNLAERRLMRTVIRFAPVKGVVGVFLHHPAIVVEMALLEAAWQAQGCPEVTLPTEQQAVLFGSLHPICHTPFAGYDDVWLEGDHIRIASKKQPNPTVWQSRFNALVHQCLLDAATAQLECFRPQLRRLPRSIQIRPLRPRILGQCTREGDIYLNLSLHHWPTEIMTETLAHELVHLEYFNHSNAFWKRLTELLPDWLPRSLAHYL